MEDIVQFFYQRKWPDGFRCPRCGHSIAYTIHSEKRSLPLYQCQACKHQTTLTAGTALERSRTPLEKWAVAIQAMSRDESINAVQLMGIIAVTYKTAWSMLRKLRQCINQWDAAQPLVGRLAAGAATYGTPAFRTCLRYPHERPVIVGISYDRTGNPIYTKMKPGDAELLRNASKRRHWENEFVRNHVRSEFPVQILPRIPFHKNEDLRSAYYSATSWIHRTFRGISSRYLELYFDEYCFRINMRLHGQNPIEVLLSACMQTSSHTSIRMAAAA
ncbi:IS1595 family transposase [Paenibacillus sp.]|uniref:IS1595 family transposase n=1 Tax=Paenibacillus sp. TaxID=58172 RepID=UPI002D31EED5|nr:IS1595 family transposase [Paenibacillus sp.]HZG88253.1 IS1595 family transposase [Paenibacillus sp.]